ncbi:MAG: hypothetical protein J6A61_05885 [Clostridia bacterium]|nr:hypothetical protein [Clostridia bacterium]
MDIKVRLLILGKKQVDLLGEIQKRGFPKLSFSQFSRYVNKREISPQGNKVLDLSDAILEEWESKAIFTE